MVNNRLIKISLRDRLKFLFTGRTKSYTLAELMPSQYSGQPVWSEWTTDNAIQNGLKVCSYVYSCVYRLMKAAASVPWIAKIKKGEDWEPVPGHPIEELMAKPNPFMSGQDMIERATSHLYLGGNALWGKVRARGIVAELWPYYPDNIKPVRSKQEFISSYKYTDAGIIKYIEPKDIIHFMFIDPGNMFWGMSPLQAAGRVVDTEVEMTKWNKVALQNRAISDGVFSFKESMTDSQWTEARKQIREQHMGAEHARNPWVLSGGATWQQMSLSPIDMDFIAGKKMTREDVCSIFGVPPPLVCFYEHATLANLSESRRVFWLDTIIPYLQDIKECLNLTLAPEFGPDIKLVYDLSNVEAIREKFKEKVETGEKLFAMGIPLNEINQKLELGFKDYSWGEIGYVSARLFPVGTIGKEDKKPTEPKKLTASKKDLKSFNLQTEEQKVQYWKSFEQMRFGWEKVIQGSTVKLLEEEAKIYSKAYKDVDGNIKKLEKVINGRIDEWSEMLNAVYQEIIVDFGEKTYSDLLKSYRLFAKKSIKGLKDFDPYHNLIISWSKEWSATRATLISEGSKSFCNRIITVGVDANRTIDQISKDLRKYYDQDKIYRSYRMARTEVVGSSNYGSWEGAKQANIPKMLKTWVSARDDRVRDSHTEIDGQTVGMDGFFYIGGYPMNYPGDPAGPAIETIMCRCAISYKTG